MINMMETARTQLREMLMSALGALVAKEKIPAEPLPAFRIEVPADTSRGDFATNIAMASAKALHCPPRSLAALLESELSFEGTYFSRLEIAGPGFMNFFLDRRWFSDTVRAILDEKDTYGTSNAGQGRRALVEFVSANPTGPMHVGNARGAALGDGIASLLEWTGWHVEREFYVNDAGNQIEKFALSLEIRYLQCCGEAVELPEDAYQGEDITAHAQAFYETYGDRYLQAESRERREALTAFALPKNIEGLERDLRRYRVEYDHWFRESTLHEDGSVQAVVDELTKRGYTYEQDGAIWFHAEQFGAEKDFVLVRANGVPTYIVPDIAYHCDKLVKRGFDKAINVLGADHHGYVPRLKAALKALGVDTSRLDVVLMQMVILLRDGKVTKVSKRSGKAIGLVTLLDEIPLDAARFFFNMREANSHFEFDLDLAVEQSSKNPVYYVQYAHARICSILRNLKQEGVYTEDFAPAGETPQETELIRHLAQFPEVVAAGAAAYDPSRITKYATELATLFHRFYDACSVKNAETEALRAARTSLCRAVWQTLRNALTILKIDCPETM